MSARPATSGVDEPAPALASYRLRSTRGAPGSLGARVVLVVLCSAGAVALLGPRLLPLGVAATLATLWMHRKHRTETLEEGAALELHRDHVRVCGLARGDLEIPLEGLDAFRETARTAAVVGLGSPAELAGARALVLQSVAIDGERLAIPESSFVSADTLTRFLRDLEQLRAGEHPSGPARPVAPPLRDALDDRIDRELARLRDQD